MYGQSKLQDVQTDHRIDMVMLAICVSLSPFLVCWHVQLPHQNRLQFHSHLVLLLHLAESKGCPCSQNCIFYITQISGAVILLFVVDFLFAVIEFPVWTAFDANNSVWQELRPMHNFGIFLFVVINILKIVLLVLTCKGIKSYNNQIQ